MRQVTTTEKYRAVNEGKLTKGEFVRQMRIAHPTVISQWSSYNDTVTILKNKGFISEKTGVDTYDSRYDLNISSESIDRGVRYELAAQGHDPATVTDKEVVAKVTDRVVKNLKKDPLHYINLLSGESSNVNKHDREEEVKRGEGKKDVFNGGKKADLKESVEDKKELPKSIADKERDQIEKDAKKAKGMIKEDPKENIIAVAKEIRAKYGQIPGFNVLLKDFLQTHQHEIKAGEVGPEDAIAEFDNFVDANYDRLDEKEEVNEYRGSGEDIKAIIRDKAADSGFSEQEEAMEVMEFIGQEYEIDFEFGAGPSRMAEKNGRQVDEGIGSKIIDKVKNLVKKNISKLGADTIADIKAKVEKALGKPISSLGMSDVNMDNAKKVAAQFGLNEASMMDKYPKFFGALGLGGLATAIGFGTAGIASGPMVLVGIAAMIVSFLSTMEIEESSVEEKKGKDHDGDGDIDSDDYMAAKDKAIKKAMGKDEVALKETLKAIVTKVLEEGVINEAATNELARLADDYAGFEGMKTSILDLQNIVTDIESFYDKTREKIQKVYDKLGEIRNEEGLKVGGFLAPSIESAFNKDLRPVTKAGFTKGLDTPKVKTISSAEVDAARAAGEIEEEPKQTIFSPVNENKK